MENDGERNVYHLEAKRKKHHLHLSGRDVEEGFREDMPARSPPYNEAPSCYLWASQVAQLLKNLPAMQETPAWFLGWEVPLSSLHGLPWWLRQ